MPWWSWSVSRQYTFGGVGLCHIGAIIINTVLIQVHVPVRAATNSTSGDSFPGVSLSPTPSSSDCYYYYTTDPEPLTKSVPEDQDCRPGLH